MVCAFNSFCEAYNNEDKYAKSGYIMAKDFPRNCDHGAVDEPVFVDICPLAKVYSGLLRNHGIGREARIETVRHAVDSLVGNREKE